MNINLSISAAPSITSNDIVVAIYDTTAPSTVVAYQSFAAPHTAPQNISFTNIPAGCYNVIVYQAPTNDPTAGGFAGVTEFQFVYDPQWGSATVRTDLVLTGGVSSGFSTGANSYTDNTLTGWEYSIERRGIGTLIAGIDVSIQSNGFTLLASGDVIGAGELFILHFQPQITTVQPLNVITGGQMFGGGEVLTVDTTLAASDMGKVINLAAATAVVLNITLPASSSVSNYKMTVVNSEGGSHTVANIIPAGSDQIEAFNDTWSNSDPFAVCQGESFWIYYDGTAWRIINAVGNWGKVGEIFFSDSLFQLNCLQLNGGLGTLLRSKYPRLIRFILQKLDSSLIVVDGSGGWSKFLTSGDLSDSLYPNMGKYSSGDGSTTFRLPQFHNSFDSNNNLKTGGFLRIANGTTDIAGVQHKDKVGNFDADIQAVQIGLASSGNVGDRVSVLARPAGGISNNPVADVPFTGKNPIAPYSANNETAPFARNIYCFIRF